MPKSVENMFSIRKSDRITEVPNELTLHIDPLLSAQEVIAIDDLLKEILLRLPAKPLIRFKSVSKHWNFIISNKDFLNLRNPYPLGLFFHFSSFNRASWSKFAQKSNSPLQFLPLKHDDSHFESINSVPNLSSLIILNSCYGLLLCLGYNELKHKGGYQVLNPTTKQFATIETPRFEENDHTIGSYLAYDPTVSPHYKIVIIRLLKIILADFFTNDVSVEIIIEIYSSEAKFWSVCPSKYTIKGSHYTCYGGVYWNGAINWLNSSWTPMYFNLEEERMGNMPALISPQGKTAYDAHNLYFGTGQGHLYCSEIYSTTVIFNVYEMKKDYSEWVMKYNVDLTILAAYYPIMFKVRGVRIFCSYDVLYLVPGSDDEEKKAFVVLHIPGKFIRYNLVDNSYKIIHEYDYEAATLPKDPKYELQTNPYIESFCSV